MQAEPMRILILEDSAADAEIIARTIKRAGISCEINIVDNQKSFIEALQSFNPAVVLSDFTLPDIDGLSALQISRNYAPDAPFIIVTGSISEEVAVQCMKSGADDYIIKDNVIRLTPAIESAFDRKKLETDKRKADEALERAYNFYLSMFEKIPGMIWRMDQQGNLNYVNQAMVDFVGKRLEEGIGRGWLNFIHPDDRKKVEEEQYAAISNCLPFNMEYRLLHNSGDYRWILDIGKPYDDIKGSYAGYLGMCIDLTERKTAEEKTLRRNRLYSIMSNVSKILVGMNDNESLMREVCKIAVEEGKFKMAWMGIYDNRSREVKPIAVYGDHHGYIGKFSFGYDDAGDHQSFIQIVHSSGKAYISNMLDTDPHMRYYKDEALKRDYKSAAAFPIKFEHSVMGIFQVFSSESNYFNEDEVKLLSGVTEDVSFALGRLENERKRREAEHFLSVSEERFRTLVQSMDDIVFVLDMNRRYSGVYGKWLENNGLTVDKFLGRTPEEIFDVETAKIYKEMIDSAMMGKSVLFNWSIKLADGRHIMQSSLSPYRNPKGIITGVVGVGRDLTELRDVQETQRLQSAALEATANAVILTNNQGQVIWANPAFTQLTGYTPDEVMGQDLNILKSGKHNSAFYENMWNTIKSGKVWEGEIINKRKDGTLYNEEMTITPVMNPDDTVSHYIAIKQDVTHQKMFQKHLFQSQKMDSVGTLASGIAHDFNNILGIITGYISLIEKNRQSDEKFYKNLQAINRAVKRGATLVHQILTFARKSEVSLDLVNVNSSLSELAKMLDETFPKTISINLHLSPKVPILIMDQGQFHQSILNLSVNARDAILEKDSMSGSISISTDIVQGMILKEAIPEADAVKYVSISVSDTGTGMDEFTLQRIFEPFYTMKKHGQGTGLGLSVVYGVVKSYQGFIDVQSEVGKGSTFTLYLPVRAAAGTPEIETEDYAADNSYEGNEVILLVEDEELLVEAIKSILEEKGYSVLTASDGIQALEVFMKNMDAVKLVISDVGLPKKSGIHVVKRIRELDGKIPIILASGYLDPILRKELGQEGVYTFIKKPYQPKELLFTIRTKLDA